MRKQQQHSSSRKAQGRSGRKARRDAFTQEQEAERFHMDAVHAEAKRMVAAANKKAKHRRRKMNARSPSQSDEDEVELLVDPTAGEQLFSTSKRKFVGDLQEDQEDEEEMGGQAGDGTGNFGDRDESDQMDKETGRGAAHSSLLESNSNSDSNSERGWYPGVQSKQHADGTAATLLRATASEADVQEPREGQNAAPAAPDPSAPAPTQPAWAQGTGTPEEYVYMSPDEGEGMMEDKKAEEPPTTHFDSDHAEEARRRYDRSNSGAFVAAAGEPSTEQDFVPRATDLEKASARLGENQERHDDRVKAIVNSGYNLEETIIALRATKEFGMESTKRAGEYLRRNSKTPIPSIEKRL
jgi:hypothetical protein